MVDDIQEIETHQPTPPFNPEVAKPQVMLRHPDGSPVTIEFRQDHQWEMDTKTGIRKQGIIESFNPKFDAMPNVGALVKIEAGNDRRFFEIVTPLKGQEVKKGPTSTYANQIDETEFTKLSNEPGRVVVVPSNIPQDIV